MRNLCSISPQRTPRSSHATLPPVPPSTLLLFPHAPPRSLDPRLPPSAAIVLYCLFLFYAARDQSDFLFLDCANLIIHEAGHYFFSWGQHMLMILGGTLGELIVPFLCAIFFFYYRQTYGLAFSLFWFFENFLYIGTYMADARTLSLLSSTPTKAIGPSSSSTSTSSNTIKKLAT